VIRWFLYGTSDPKLVEPGEVVQADRKDNLDMQRKEQMRQN